jgi:hypothetical protein
MPQKLDQDETVVLQIKLPISLKGKAQRMATAEGDGDLSSWVRRLVHREWKRFEGDHDYVVEVAEGSFGFTDVGLRGSPTPRWEVHQTYESKAPRRIGSIYVHVHSEPVCIPAAPHDGLILEVAWAKFQQKHGPRVGKRPRLTT